jgi:hypothetical protein
VARDEQASGELKKMLEAFVQTATQSLQDNTAGARAARNR